MAGQKWNYIFKKESTQLPVRVQNYSITDENLVDIKIDSVSLFFLFENSGTTTTPISGYITTTWKFKKEYSFDSQYSIFSDDYASDYEYDYKKYLVPLNGFDDAYISGNFIEYNAEWPLDNPFKKN